MNVIMFRFGFRNVLIKLGGCSLVLLNCIALYCVLYFSNIMSKIVRLVFGEATLSFGLFLSSQVASLPASQVEEGVITSVYRQELDSAAEDDEEGTVYFILEESSGYMEPSLHLLAVAHTVISFCCIIGYYRLKVQYSGLSTHLQIDNERLRFSPSYRHGVYFKTTVELTIQHIANKDVLN